MQKGGLSARTKQRKRVRGRFWLPVVCTLPAAGAKYHPLPEGVGIYEPHFSDGCGNFGTSQLITPRPSLPRSADDFGILRGTVQYMYSTVTVLGVISTPVQYSTPSILYWSMSETVQ